MLHKTYLCLKVVSKSIVYYSGLDFSELNDNLTLGNEFYQISPIDCRDDMSIIDAYISNNTFVILSGKCPLCNMNCHN